MQDKISDQQIEGGLWWLKNRQLIRKVITILLIVLCAILIIYFVYASSQYLVKRSSQTDYLAVLSQERIDYQEILGQNSPFDLEIVEVQVFQNKSKIWDVLAKVNNNNTKWYASSCDYYFSVDGNRLNTKKTYFLPEEERYLVEIGYELAETSLTSKPTVDLVVNNCNWEKIKDVSNIPEAIFNVNDFDIKQSTALDSGSITTNQNVNTDIYGFPVGNTNSSFSGTSLTQVVADVTNKSVYGFWNTQAVVILSQNETIVAVNQLNLEKFLSFENRLIQFNWPKYFSRGIKADVYFYTNSLSQENLISLGDL